MSEPAEQNEKIEEKPAEAPAAEAEVASLREEVASLKDRMLRAAAEAENTRKRARRDVEEGAKYAVTAFAKDLVGVAENLQRALDNIPPEQAVLRQGVEMTQKELLAALERHGVRRIDPLGQKFDHNFHQAVAQIESPEHAAGTIVQVMQAGYVIHDRLLRPAMVGVAKQGETPKQVDTMA